MQHNTAYIGMVNNDAATLSTVQKLLLTSTTYVPYRYVQKRTVSYYITNNKVVPVHSMQLLRLF